MSTNISYAVYLTQFSIFHYNAGVSRTPDYYNKFSTIVSSKFKLKMNYFLTNFSSLQVNIYELIGILAASVALTLFIEIPFSNIKKLLFSNKSTTKDATQHKNKDTENNNGHIPVAIKKID